MTDIPDEIIDEYRYIVVDHEWWDFIQDEFIKDMEGKGIEIQEENVHFSGFSSQGDGACFGGDIKMQDFLKAHPHLLKDFPFHKQLFDIYPDGVGLSVSGGGRYSHEYTMSLNAYYAGDLEEYFNVDEPLGKLAWEALDVGTSNESEAFEQAVLDICRGYAREYYKTLEKEFEHLTSDEHVKEWLVANEVVAA